ncbi:DNA polymerase III subunit alpha [Limosilactobacillus sp.]|uniref:DNA polymerase III subunit alpha n=1 Tax=Limosilactobacillus sp. TaxID=2773925 RepID=UPI003F057F11
MAFVPLDVRSSFSLLQSPTRIPALVAAAKEKGYEALALTDENVLYGAVDFYNAARQADIKPLLGMKMRLALEQGTGDSLMLTFIAKSRQGYQNLMDLSSRHQTTNPDQLPLTIDQVGALLGDLFVIVPPQTGLFSAFLHPDRFLEELQKFTDPGGLLLGISPDLDPVQRTTLTDLAHTQGISLVGTRPVEYLAPTDQFATKVLRAIQTGGQLEDITQQAKERGTHYLRSASQELAAYQQAGLDQAAEKTVQLAQQCDVELEFKAPVLPHFATPQALSSQEYLRSLCERGLAKRPLATGFTKQDYQDRLDHELAVIHQMGFDDYFLIVWDVMNFAHRQHMATDPGRGSAAGSLVAYALAITEVDPLAYHLLFERFLNPERAQMPDIDLDIPDNRRNEVLQYVHDKYGHQHVGQIITFGTLGAKQVLRDVSRVFNWPRYDVNELLGTLPDSHNLTLASALENSQRLHNFIDDHPDARLLMMVAQQLEGLPRHYSTHAAGIVLSEQPLHEIVPLQDGGEGLLMTQFTKGTVEALGLLKMDFLGLKNLSILAKTRQLVHQEHPDFSPGQIPYDDPATLQLFQRGQTDGVFQFESSGIRNVLVSLHPDRFEDIIAVNALYRPGPLENISHFIARKHGQENYRIPDPALRTILAPTYGILVYQEQVMQLASAMAGFTLGEADLLRRAMSKKKAGVMAGMRDKFLKGAVKNGFTMERAQQVFDYIDQFANYGFNRSHAVAYSMLAFELAYLKCHYPSAFYTALMGAETNLAKLRQHVANARKLGVVVKGPRINVSDASFTLHDGQVYFGLADIKGMRRDFTAEIIKERINGPYQDLRDFINRIPARFRKQELVEPLIYAGAFDRLGYNRAEMIAALPELVSGIDQLLSSFQDDPSLQSTITRHKEFPLTDRLLKENEYLGVYLSGHPVSQYRRLGEALHVQTIDRLRPGQNVTILLFVNHVKTIYTKRDHRPMAFVSGSDQTGTIDVTAFPKQYQRYAELLKNNQILVVHGKVEERPGRGTQLLADRIQAVATLQKQLVPNQRWVIRVFEAKANRQVMSQLNDVMHAHHGDVPVLLYYPETDAKHLQVRAKWLDRQPATEQALKQLFGAANVVLQTLKN